MKNEKKNNNIINFPNSLTNGEREVEAILFAASEPLEIESIEARLNKKVDVKKILKKLEKIYENRGFLHAYFVDGRTERSYVECVFLCGHGICFLTPNYKGFSEKIQEPL